MGIIHDFRCGCQVIEESSHDIRTKRCEKHGPELNKGPWPPDDAKWIPDSVYIAVSQILDDLNSSGLKEVIQNKLSN